ncbi:MAG: cytochrome c biogenesis protein ResB [Acidobacteriota bacterium]|nr:MAG: cytochrome c biogenesis protein ResB [Acidobacteriota bacterium]
MWKLLTSRTLAIVSFSLITGLLILSTALPNPLYLSEQEEAQLHPVWLRTGEALNTQRVVESWPFIGLCLYLLVNTALCSIQRIPRRNRAPDRPPEEAFSKAVPIDMEDFLLQRLAGRGWRVASPAPGRWIAKRGRWGFWGSTVFHANLLMIIVGAILQALFGLSASLVVAEGQTVPLVPESLQKVVRRPRVFFCLQACSPLSASRPCTRRRFIPSNTGRIFVTTPRLETPSGSP